MSTARIIAGGVPMRVTEVIAYDHRHKRVLVKCSPDVTPRWVSLRKPLVKL